MRYGPRLPIWLALLLALGVAKPASAFTIYAVNGPLGYFAQRIAGDFAEVHMPAPAGGDPAFWQPNGEEIAAFQGADLILLNGADYAKWTQQAALPRARTVDTSKAFQASLIAETGGATHSHGGGDAHSHAGIAFTTWLDFDLAARHAQAVAAAIAAKRPDDAAVIETNLAALQADLAGLDETAKTLGAELQGQPIIVSHPIYQYFARAYGFELISLVWEPDVVPDAEQLADLDAMIAESGAAFMIWENAPIEAAAALTRERGLTNLVFKTGNDIAPSEDFIGLMQNGLEELARAR